MNECKVYLQILTSWFVLLGCSVMRPAIYFFSYIACDSHDQGSANACKITFSEWLCDQCIVLQCPNLRFLGWHGYTRGWRLIPIQVTIVIVSRGRCTALTRRPVLYGRLCFFCPLFRMEFTDLMFHTERESNLGQTKTQQFTNGVVEMHPTDSDGDWLWFIRSHPVAPFLSLCRKQRWLHGRLHLANPVFDLRWRDTTLGHHGFGQSTD